MVIWYVFSVLYACHSFLLPIHKQEAHTTRSRKRRRANDAAEVDGASGEVSSADLTHVCI